METRSLNRNTVVTLSADSIEGLTINQSIISVEEDEGIPVLFDGYNPYGGLNCGITVPVRWTDD